MNKGRLPSLDGLRAISIALVIACHAVKVAKAALGRLPYGMGMIEDWGSVGVTTFFVISGFLITTLLCEEEFENGRINLRAFYTRRAFRILPAYWTYLLTMMLLAVSGSLAATPRMFGEAFAFVSDYIHLDPWVLGHSWSLSVEEQFYLLWPFLLLLAATRRARQIALVLIFAAPAARIATYLWAPELRPTITSVLHLRIDALMIGCWAALERRRDPRSATLAFLSRPAVALAASATAVFASPVLRHVAGDFVGVAICYSLEAIGACSAVLAAISHASSPVGRLLNWPPLVRVGVLSYSLYLWQQPWLNPEAGRPAWALPLLIAGAYVCAELSYRLVEGPALALRGRLWRSRPERAVA
jgi:peptidoglycan/LPS O-acetylase OafA/YrhL